MRHHHRMPALFTLSMLDVLCCGLGAMILLMLLNHLDASRSSSALKLAENRGSVLAADVEKLQTEAQRLATALGLSESEKAKVERGQALAMAARNAAERGASDLRQQIATMDLELKATKALLVRARDDRLDAENLLATARERQASTQERILNLQRTLDAASKRGEELSARLQTSEKDKAVALDAVAEVTRLKTELEEARQRAATLEADVMRWQKNAEAAGVKVTSAEEAGKKALLDAATLRRLLDDQQATSGRLRQELHQAANRFAGVDLSGKRVIMIVDKSGSMASVEPQKASPEKWPALCRSVGQVLRSLPEAEKFQLIVFSDKAEFILGQPDQWLPCTKDSSTQAEQTLLKVDPNGNTNMYAALEAAFRFKSQGLDAIYLFSDGLPNVGPGLPPNPPPDEPSQSAILGRHLRDVLKSRWNKDDPKVRIHSVGFYYESPNLGAFLWALSRDNGGSFVGMSQP